MSSVTRRQLTHLGLLFGATLFIRALLFNYVGIWGDAGFYIYDARLIMAGQTPYVDFVGRSPLFNYSYAWVASVLGNTMPVLRAYIAVWWVLCGLPVYYIGRAIGDHASGLAAAAVMLLTPFMLVYGYWANTQSLAAFLAISGLAALVWRPRAAGYALAGLGIGAAFLSRRSVITILGAVGLYAIYQTVHERGEPSQAIAYGSAAVVGFLVPLAGGYLALGGGDVALAVQFAETHGWGLISSSGRGGFPLLTEQQPPDVTNQIETGRIPIFNDVCQMCGSWTARTFAKTTLVTTPVIGPFFWYFRDWSDRWFSDRLRDYTFGVLLMLAAYAIVEAITAGFYLRPFVAVTLVTFAVLAFRTPAIDRELLYHPRLVLFGLCCLGLAVGYLYRNRVLHTYYFSDFFPYLSVIAGVVGVAAWRVMDE